MMERVRREGREREQEMEADLGEAVAQVQGSLWKGGGLGGGVGAGNIVMATHTDALSYTSLHKHAAAVTFIRTVLMAKAKIISTISSWLSCCLEKKKDSQSILLKFICPGKPRL